MSGLNRLSPGADPSNDGRGQLQETLDMQANAIRLLRKELDLVKDADRIVRPVPIEAFPVAAGQIYTGEEGGEVGDITWRAKSSAPVGTLACDGAEYPEADYADLFAAIGTTYNTGGETTNHFRVPDLKGRTMVGTGTSTTAGGATAWTLGLARGDERSESHQHAGPSHQHDMEHQHGWNATITVTGTDKSDGFKLIQFSTATNYQDGTLTTASPDASHEENLGIRGVANAVGGGTLTSASGTGSTGSAFNGTDKNVQPSLALTPYIRYRLGPTDTIQTLPISWGPLNAQWQLDTLKNFPKSAVSNLHTVQLANTGGTEAVVRITAVGGTESGNSSAIVIVGVMRLPYNFRAFRSNALVIRTKVNSDGCATSSSAAVTLKVSDPLISGSYLPDNYSRTIAESSNVIADSDYVDAVITAEQLTRAWKPGYLLRFELAFSHPKLFTTARLDVGRLELNWR